MEKQKLIRENLHCGGPLVTVLFQLSGVWAWWQVFWGTNER
jgi:hypothetical protein